MTQFIRGEFLFVPMYPLRAAFRAPLHWHQYDFLITQTDTVHLVCTRFSHYDNTSGKTWIAYKIFHSSTEPTKL